MRDLVFPLLEPLNERLCPGNLRRQARRRQAVELLDVLGRGRFRKLGESEFGVLELAAHLRDPVLEGRDQLLALEDRHEAQRRHQRIDQRPHAPQRLAQQRLELVLTFVREAIGRPLRTPANLIRADHLEQSVARHRLERVVDRAGRHVGPLVDPPGEQLAPHVVAVHRLEYAHDAEHQKTRGGHGLILSFPIESSSGEIRGGGPTTARAREDAALVLADAAAGES